MMITRALNRTPEVVAWDGRGLAVRQIAYLRKAADAAIEPLITRQYYNVIGAEIEKWDARLFGAKARPNLATVSSLNGQPLKIDSVDAGWRLTLRDWPVSLCSAGTSAVAIGT
ncbi:hypothetical protein RCC30_23150 [Pseudomonas fluorescens]|nr:hypothetical protein RCC30_23150 [Pseudomonas fluorescens]